MKLIRFLRQDGSIGWGVDHAGEAFDISSVDRTFDVDTSQLIKAWGDWEPRWRAIVERSKPMSSPIQLLCPISDPQKVLCIGLNYRQHAVETGMAIPSEPIVFCKMGTAVVGPQDPILLPPSAHRVDYEAELVIVIGRSIHQASEEEAERAIFGYLVGNDVSARDWQLEKPGKQWFLGKSFDTFAPVGPSITLASAIPDLSRLAIQLKINGELLQNSTLADLIFSPKAIVAYLSQVMTLHPGDMIFTGTPEGVGMARTPPRFLKPGDLVEVTIESLGTIANRCVEKQR